MELSEHGQVRFSLSDARQILASIQEIASSRSAGRCPNLEVESFSDSEVAFVVNEMCTHEAGGLVGRFRVNRYTGMVRSADQRPQQPTLFVSPTLLDQLRRARSQHQLSADTPSVWQSTCGSLPPAETTASARNPDY